MSDSPTFNGSAARPLPSDIQADLIGLPKESGVAWFAVWHRVRLASWELVASAQSASRYVKVGIVAWNKQGTLQKILTTTKIEPSPTQVRRTRPVRFCRSSAS